MRQFELKDYYTHFLVPGSAVGEQLSLLGAIIMLNYREMCGMCVLPKYRTNLYYLTKMGHPNEKWDTLTNVLDE